MALKAACAAALFACANAAVYRGSGFFERERRYHATVAAAQDDDVGILLLGDSHVDKIPRDLLAATTRNVASGGDGYRELYAKLRYLLEKSPGLRTIVLSADYHMFGAGRAQSSNRSFVERYLLATGAADGYEKGRLSAAMNLLPLCNDDFVQYLKKDLRVTLQRARSGDNRESEPWANLPAGIRHERAAATGRGDHVGVGTTAEPLVWYERIIQMARIHNVNVVAVRMPADAGYLMQIPAAGRERVDAALHELGVEPVDLGHALDSADYFADEDHVNSRGAVAVLCLLRERAGLNLGTDAALRECP